MGKGGFRPFLFKFDEERYNMDKTEISQKVEYLLSLKEWILTYLEGVEIDLVIRKLGIGKKNHINNQFS